MKYDELGALIRELRANRGWDQHELAHQAQVGQQAVSSWERGASRPKRNTITRLATILSVDVGTLVTAAGYAEPPTGADTRPLLLRLPLAGLGPEAFENFVTDLAAVSLPDLHWSRFGGQGHKQFGFDVVGYDGTTLDTGIQCKRHQQFGPGNVKAAVAAQAVTARRCIIALSRPASSPARLELAKHAGWEFWDSEDLSRMVRQLPKDKALRIVDTYFPRLRSDFLGIPEPSPWLTSEEFFLRLENNQLLPYDNEVIGQSLVLEQAKGLASASSTFRVATLVGRGGLGKTRLIRAMAEVADSTLEVRFLDRDRVVAPHDFELLPTTRPCLLIIDDAFDRSDIAGIVSGVFAAQPGNKVLFTSRPHGVTAIRRSMQKLGRELPAECVWNIAEPTTKDAVELARQALGSAATNHLARLLGITTRDCPLLTVLGGRLISQSRLDAKVLQGSDRLRQEILAAFEELMVDGGGGDAEARRSILDVVACLQPFDAEDNTCRSAMESLVGMPFDRAFRHLRGLEESGLLLQRGTSFRVVPDLFGEMILADASVDRSSGMSLGFLSRVLAVTRGRARLNLIVNASRMDWQVRQDVKVAQPLVGEVWDALEDEFRAADDTSRRILLSLVRDVSYFQPDRALRVVKLVLEEAVPGSTLLDELPDVLVGVGHDLRHLPEVLNILWGLARTDDRDPQRTQNHPLRALQSLATYEPARLVEHNRLVLETANDWLDEQQADDIYSPFDVLEGLLATEGHETFFDEMAVTMSNFGVNVSAVKSLRHDVLDLALRQISSPNLKLAVRAVKVFEAGLHYTPHMANQQDAAGEGASWIAELIENIDMLKDVAADTTLDPVIAIAIRGALQWHVDYSSYGTQPAAREIVDLLPQTAEHELALLLHDSCGTLIGGRLDNMQQRDAIVQERRSKLTKALLDDFDDPSLIDLIEKRLTVDREAFDRSKPGQPGPLVADLVTSRPSLGERMCERAINNPGSRLREVLFVIISVFADVEPALAIDWSHRLCQTGEEELERAVWGAMCWGRGSRDLIPGELELLQSFASDSRDAPRQTAAHAAHIVGDRHHTEALSLALGIRFDDSEAVTKDVMTCVAPPYAKINWRKLTDTQLSGLLSQLERCPSWDGYPTQSFLAAYGQTYPVEFFQLAMRRVEVFEKDSDFYKFSVLPHVWTASQTIEVDVLDAARLVHDWLAQAPDSSQRGYFAPKLFKLFAGPVNRAVLERLRNEMFRTSEQRFRTVASVLQNAPRDLIFDNLSLISEVIEAAHLAGQPAASDIEMAISSALTSGVRSGAPGQPFTEDVANRDLATQAASQLPAASPARTFFEGIARAAEESMQWKAAEDARFLDRRSW